MPCTRCKVAIGRILGYRWPSQVDDSLTFYADVDGIASLAALPGEPDLATRLREVLAVEYGSDWSSARERKLVMDACGKRMAGSRLAPRFVLRSARQSLRQPAIPLAHLGWPQGWVLGDRQLPQARPAESEKLTFTSLGAWIDRQKHETRAERAGADARLAAAEGLQRKLKLILEGAPPHDVYVRWKSMAEQPIGWEPDLDDGVRVNIRPFVTAGVLRSKVNVHWKKDRGTNPDGSERHNDLHPTLDERRAARRAAESTE